MMLDASAKGVYVIAATPFHPDGRLDTLSVDRLTDFQVEAGKPALRAPVAAHIAEGIV